MPKSTCGVKIFSWGTHSDSGNGMGHYLDAKFFGGNVGHVSMAVTFPANEQGKELLKKYCTNPPIPYEKHKVTIAKQGSKEPSNEEEVYVVRFSWWPGFSGFGMALSESPHLDALQERAGVHMEYNPKWKEFLQPETRHHSGKLGSQTMVYAPTSITHPIGLSDAQLDILKQKHLVSAENQELDSINVLLTKFESNVIKINGFDERTARVKNKKAEVGLLHNKITVLTKLIGDLTRGYVDAPTYSNADKILLDTILPNWKDKGSLAEAKALLKKTEKDHMILSSDSMNKIEMDRSKVTHLSKNDIILLNRFIPAWKENFNINETSVIPHEIFTEIVNQLTPRKEDLERTIDTLKDKLLQAKTAPEGEENASSIEYKRLEEEHVMWEAVYIFASEVADKRAKGYIKENESGPLPEDLIGILDQVASVIDFNWRQLFIERSHENPIIATHDEAQRLMNFVLSKKVELAKQMIDIEPALGNFKQSDYESFLTLGLPPDNTVQLPFDKNSNAPNGVANGLNLEAMLKAMQDIAKNKRFDLNSVNCSQTVSKVLEAGARNNHLKSKFSNNALGTISNPQMVHRNALDFLQALKSPQDNILKKILRFNPIERAGGWILNKLYIEPKVPIDTKIAAGLLSIPIGIYLGIKTILTAVVKPLKTAKLLAHFIGYAFKRPNIGLKLLAAVAVIPLTIISPLAAINLSINKIGSALGSFVKKVQNTIKQNKHIDHIDVTQKEKAQDKVFSNIASQIIKQVAVKEIGGNTPEEVFTAFDRAVMNDPSGMTILTLSEKSRKMLESAIAKTTDPDLKLKFQEEYKGMQAKTESILLQISKNITALKPIEGVKPPTTPPPPNQPRLYTPQQTTPTKNQIKEGAFDESNLWKVSGWHNNCAANCVVHFLSEKIITNELQETFAHDPDYEGLLNSFEEYYNLDKKPTWDDIQSLLSHNPAPTDREAIMGPVIRQYLAKVIMQNKDDLWLSLGSGAISEFITTGKALDVNNEVYRANMNQFKEYKREYDNAIRASLVLPISEQERAAALKQFERNKVINPTEEQIERNVQFNRTNDIQDRILVKANDFWDDDGCENYANRMGDLKEGVMISSDQLSLLSRALSFNSEVHVDKGKGLEKLVEVKDPNYKWLLKVKNQGNHWENENPITDKSKGRQATHDHNAYYKQGPNRTKGKYDILGHTENLEEDIIHDVQRHFRNRAIL